MDGPRFELEDGFPAGRLFAQGVSYTYDDVILLPHYIDFPMDTVSESAMAVGMAALGGAAIVHCNATPACQAAIVRSAKSCRIPFVTDTPFFAPSDRIDYLIYFNSAPYALATESGMARSRADGVVARSDWEILADKNAPVSECMRPAPASAPASCDFEQVAAFLAGEGLEYAPLVAEDGEVVDLVTAEHVERIQSFPKLGVPSVGPDGRFLVGAAIGTGAEDKERLEHLVKAGVNVVVMDSSQGNSIYQIDVIKYAKNLLR